MDGIILALLIISIIANYVFYKLLKIAIENINKNKRKVLIKKVKPDELIMNFKKIENDYLEDEKCYQGIAGDK